MTQHSDNGTYSSASRNLSYYELLISKKKNLGEQNACRGLLYIPDFPPGSHRQVAPRQRWKPPFCLHPCLLRSILGKAHLSADNAFLISDCEQCTILRIQLRWDCDVQRVFGQNK